MILSNKDKTFLVLVDQYCFVKLFNFLNLPNVILIVTKNPSIKELNITKKKLLEQIGKYNISKIYFFHNEFGDISNWLIHKLSHKVKIYHGEIYKSLPYPTKYNLKGLKLKIRYQLLYQTNIDPKYNGSRFIPSLSHLFFKANNINNIKCDNNLELISKYINDKLNIQQNKILLLTGSVVSSQQVDALTYEKYMDKIITAIGEKNILSKCHPRFNDLFGKECELQQVPSYIPANLILNNFECFIGYNSTLLVEAAAAGKKAISLIDIIPPLNSHIPQSWHSFFMNRLNNNTTIFFPRNIQELLKYIKS